MCQFVNIGSLRYPLRVNRQLKEIAWKYVKQKSYFLKKVFPIKFFERKAQIFRDPFTADFRKQNAGFKGIASMLLKVERREYNLARLCKDRFF